jgi:hypothetical protein
MTGSKGSEPGHTDETACETTANASQRLRTYYVTRG